MLARPGCTLSAELYSEIFLYLSRRDLVQLSRTCRVLFNVTIGHIWRVVRLRPLLALLPGLCIVPDSGGLYESIAPTLGISMLSKDYYARFSLYAPYVEVLKTESWSYLCSPSKYFSDRPAYSSLHQVVLPALKDVDMAYKWSSSSWVGGAYDKPSLMWMTLLIPPTLQSLSFTATDQRDLSLLGTLLARCPQLTRFKFRPDQRPNWDTWLSFSAFRIPQEIMSLEVFCAEINNVGYSWLSKLPKLQSLELLLCQRFSRMQPHTLHSGSYNPPPSPTYPHAFSALRSLSISVTDKNKLQQIIQIWCVIAAHITHATIKASKQAWSLDMFDKLFAGLALHCSEVSFLQFKESEINNGIGMLPLTVSHFSALQPLPLRILRINRPLSMPDDCNILAYMAKLFPELEELWLEGTPIMIEELLQATVYFPHIRHLEIGLHTLKPRSRPLNHILKDQGQHVDSDHTSGSILALELCVIERQEDRRAFSAEDWDFIAGFLTLRWSSISIKPSPIEDLLERTFKINEKFAFHSAQRVKNKCREEETP
ncbi:hypothetical protein ACGC1H_002245 [Rhizoctonia solani]|uniref:F-box domain-containing protein n=1 Tax=Rhizoctonia solani TaxID=456999 RepID=A0A8H3AG81_9AGAM|nr:unnamed protein product [Rhizoctonia solani]